MQKSLIRLVFSFLAVSCVLVLADEPKGPNREPAVIGDYDPHLPVPGGNEGVVRPPSSRTAPEPLTPDMVKKRFESKIKTCYHHRLIKELRNCITKEVERFFKTATCNQKEVIIQDSRSTPGDGVTPRF